MEISHSGSLTGIYGFEGFETTGDYYWRDGPFSSFAYYSTDGDGIIYLDKEVSENSTLFITLNETATLNYYEIGLDDTIYEIQVSSHLGTSILTYSNSSTSNEFSIDSSASEGVIGNSKGYPEIYSTITGNTYYLASNCGSHTMYSEMNNDLFTDSTSIRVSYQGSVATPSNTKNMRSDTLSGLYTYYYDNNSFILSIIRSDTTYTISTLHELTARLFPSNLTLYYSNFYYNDGATLVKESFINDMTDTATSTSCSTYDNCMIPSSGDTAYFYIDFTNLTINSLLDDSVIYDGTTLTLDEDVYRLHDLSSAKPVILKNYLMMRFLVDEQNLTELSENYYFGDNLVIIHDPDYCRLKVFPFQSIPIMDQSTNSIKKFDIFYESGLLGVSAGNHHIKLNYSDRYEIFNFYGDSIYRYEVSSDYYFYRGVIVL